MKIKKSTWLPLVLLIYLVVMSYIGYPEYAAGNFSDLYYFGVIGLTLVIIVLLHLSLKRREQLRQQREDDMKNDGKK